MIKKLKDLPKSDEVEFWGEAEKYFNTAKPSIICSTHKVGNWMEHVGYLDNHDGMATCKYCNWGFRIPGYMRVVDEKVFDLRSG